VTTTDHTDLLDRAERNARRLAGLADAVVEDAQKQSPDMPMDGLPRIERDAVDTITDLAAALRAETERADRMEADRLVNFKMHVGAIKRWHETCDAVLDAVIEHGTLAAVVEVVADWLDGSDALDDEVCDRIRRAQAKAATVEEGTSYCSLAEGTVLFEGSVATTTDWSGKNRIGIVPDGPVPKRLLHRRVRVVAVDHQETT
jgi:hypothetical protein